MDNSIFIKAKLLYALARRRKWGESHTAYENMFKTLKSESLGKNSLKEATELAEELFREGLIIKKPTSYGLQVSLNPYRAHEIKSIINDALGINIS
ncbi:hypothetical protein KKF81_05655 [Candidatus Micrarchaeota archaeon]|nr:hypothetical protein [Candidatus Micrarchaeota archaeon]MBU1166414.1 hypothetical protein [Candidatus Micrarchaeota archaeon]MBU1886903.1 hypothetical protein [Candidatus Micrarchaeota archaeon]